MRYIRYIYAFIYAYIIKETRRDFSLTIVCLLIILVGFIFKKVYPEEQYFYFCIFTALLMRSILVFNHFTKRRHWKGIIQSKFAPQQAKEDAIYSLLTDGYNDLETTKLIISTTSGSTWANNEALDEFIRLKGYSWLKKLRKKQKQKSEAY